MKISLVTMVRNEMDIIKIFLRHIDSIFDKVYLVDHCSIDGTTDVLKEAVEQRPDWEYYRLDVAANLQQKITNLFLTKAFQEEADFVFILDADEFVYVKNRSALEEIVKGIQGTEQVGLLTWINCLPEDKAVSEIDEWTPLLQSPRISLFSKVVIPRSCFIKDNGIYNSTGSHETYWSDGKKVSGKLIGNIIHIPIRSEQQAIRKAFIPKIALLQKYDQDELNSNNHYQYNYFLRQIVNGEMNRFTLLCFLHVYEDADFVDDDQSEVDAYWAKALPTSFEQLNISFNRLSLEHQPKPIEIYKLIADALNETYRIHFHSIDLCLEDDKITVVGNEFIKENLDWEIQRDQLISTIEKLRQREAQLSNELKELSQIVEIQKDRELFYANSKSWRITRPLRKIMKVFRGKNE